MMRSGRAAPRAPDAAEPEHVSPNAGEEHLRGRGGEVRLVEALTLIIAMLALVIAVIAYKRTGGIQDLRRQVDSDSLTTESVREKTAGVFSRVERLIRGRDKSPQEQEEEKEGQ